MKKGLYIFGTGTHALKVYNSANLLGYKILGFIDDNESAISPVKNINIYSRSNIKVDKVDKNIIIAIGNSKVRYEIFNYFLNNGWILETIIHPSAIIAPNIKIESGIFIGAGSIVESNVTIKEGTIIDIGVVIDHDCYIDGFLHIKAGQILKAFSKINVELKS